MATARLECRRQMHYAEHLARQGVECPSIYRPAIEAAYLSPNCEPSVAKRIHAALDLI